MGNVRNPGNRKKDRAGRFGTDITSYSTSLTDLTATSTVAQALGCPYPPTSADAYYIEGVSVNMTVAAVATGTSTIKVQKVRGGSGGTVLDLTAAFSLTTGVVTAVQQTFEIPLLTTLTPIQLSFIQGDSVILSKVASAAITTQPSGVVTLEFAAGA